MPDPTIAEKAEQYREIAKEALAGGLEAAAESDVSKFVAAAVADIFGTLLKISFTILGPLGEGFMRGIAEGEDQLAPLLARYASTAVNDIFGTQLSDADFARFSGGKGRTVAGPALGRALMAQLQGAAAGALEPGDAAAAKFVGAMAGMAIEDWYKGWFFEVISSMVPLDVGKIEKYGDLSDKVARVLGIDRVSGRVLRPIVDATIVTPLQWKTNSAYRPALLTPSLAARQVAREGADMDTWREELRRQGYSEARIAVLVNEARHAFSAADVRTFVEREYWSQDQGLQHLRDQGYGEQAALDALRLEGLRRIEQLERQEGDAIIGAYVAGDIDHGTLIAALGVSITNTTERNLLIESAEVRRGMNVRRLSLSQVEAMVKSEVLSIVDYRRAAERDGYEPAAVTALELQLRWEMDRTKAIAEHRAELEAQRRAEAAARATAAATKRAALEEKRAIAKRGKRADLERAAVRGLIPLDRVAELYALEFDPDTAGILLDLLAGDRQAYLDQAARREAAEQRGAARNIDLAGLEAAVTRNILTIGQYRDRLTDLGFAPADVAILADTLQAKMEDAAAARAAREEAIAAAKVKHVSLTTIETLVRRGHRTLADYDRTLQDLGFDDGARAAMAELLQDQIDEDAKARDARAAAAAKRDTRGVSLEQMRRAAILGVITVDAFQTWLVDNRFTAEAQIVIVDSLRADIAEAESARQRRAAADVTTDTRDAPIADVARAARLGLIPVDTYVARLRRAGYTPDAIDLEADLLVEEMTDIAEARQARDAANAAAADRGLSLGQTAAAVRGGILPMGAYVAAARSAGLSEEAAAVLARLLQTEVDAAAAATARRAMIADGAAARGLSLTQLEGAVRAGLLTLDEYAARVAALGYGDGDVALLVALLGDSAALLERARARRAAIAAGAPEADMRLRELESAVLAGRITMAGALDELRGQGYGAGIGIELTADGRVVMTPGYTGEYDDTAALGLLLQATLDAAGGRPPGS